jgi:hypothetical protein
MCESANKIFQTDRSSSCCVLALVHELNQHKDAAKHEEGIIEFIEAAGH